MTIFQISSYQYKNWQDHNYFWLSLVLKKMKFFVAVLECHFREVFFGSWSTQLYLIFLLKPDFALRKTWLALALKVRLSKIELFFWYFYYYFLEKL